MTEFSHIDKNGDVKMVDVTEKFSTVRIAIAEGKIYMSSKTIEAINHTHRRIKAQTITLGNTRKHLLYYLVYQ